MSTGKRGKSVDELLHKAVELEKQGLFKEAIGELEKAVRITADKSPIYKELARLYHDHRRIDDAILIVRKAIKHAPEDVSAREMLMNMHLELSRFDDAIRESEELLRVSPHSLSARDAQSMAYLQKGMLDKALQITNELINLDPTSPVNHFKKACLFQQKGDIGNAIHEFGRVLEMQPDMEMAQDAQQAIDTLDSHQLRHIVMLAVEDYIFRAKLIRDPESAALERGYYLSYAGMNALKQIQFEDLPEIYTEWKQKFYH